MDPNETLRRLRIAYKIILNDEPEVDADSAIDLAELCEALDGWLSRGGFLPGAWKQGGW